MQKFIYAIITKIESKFQCFSCFLLMNFQNMSHYQQMDDIIWAKKKFFFLTRRLKKIAILINFFFFFFDEKIELISIIFNSIFFHNPKMFLRRIRLPSSLIKEKSFNYGYSPRFYLSTQPPKQTPKKGAQDASNQSIAPKQDKQAELNEQEKELVKNYQVDPLWNRILDLQKNHNFQHELILHRKEYNKSTYDLRSSILFEDLLKTQLEIPIYDTKGKPFYWHMLKLLYLGLSIYAAIYAFEMLVQVDPKNKVLLEKTFYGKLYKNIIYAGCIWIFIRSIFNHRSFCRKYIQKIIYDTKKEQFIMQRRALLGFRYEERISRFKIIYTENNFLASKGVNYFHIDTKASYSIIYKNAWIKQDLFSHLISQRIKI